MTELLDVQTDPTIEAQTGAPETEPSGWMPLTDEMRQSAPENVKKLLEAKKWSTFEDVAKGYSELEKFTGVGKHLVIPQDDNPEAWKNVWSQLGRPENADGYDFSEIEQAAQKAGIPLDSELMAKYKRHCFDNNKLPSQAVADLQLQLDIISETRRIENEKIEAYKAQLIKEYGGEAQYKSKVIEMRQVAERLGIYQTLEEEGIASKPTIIKMLEKIVSGTAEGVIVPPSPPTPQKNPVEELEEIKKSEAFTKKFHPQHKAVMQRFMELNMIIANSRLAPKRPQGG